MFININNFDSMPVDSSIDEVCGLLGVKGMNAAEYNTTVKDMKTLINKLSNKYLNILKKIIYKKFFLLEENTQKQLLIELQTIIMKSKNIARLYQM